MNDCVFCKIVAGEIPSQKLYEDGELIVIKDIEPKAKVHCLCIPKEHFALRPQRQTRPAKDPGVEKDARCGGRVPPGRQPGGERGAERAPPAHPHPRRRAAPVGVSVKSAIRGILSPFCAPR